MSRSRMLCVVLATSAVALGTVGCSPSHEPDAVAERVHRGTPQGWSGSEPDLLTGEPSVGWLGENELGVVTIGSSSCPPIASSIEATGPAGILIAFVPSETDPCTADMSATTHVFALPEGVDQRPLAVTLELGSEERSLLLE